MTGWNKPSTTIRTGLLLAGLVAQLISGTPALAQRSSLLAAKLPDVPVPSQIVSDVTGRERVKPSVPELLAEPPQISYGQRRLGRNVKVGGHSTIPMLLAEPAVPREVSRNLEPRAVGLNGAGVSPTTGTGTSQTFAFTYYDPAGATDLRYVEALVNTAVNGAGACFLHYDVPSNGLYLRNDTNSGWLGPLTLGVGSTAFLSNSQCTVSASGSSVASNGAFLTLTANVTFNSSYVGTKTIFENLVDLAGNAPAQWYTAGTFTIPTSASATPTAPTVTAVNPINGTILAGATQLFSLTYNDIYGSNDIFFTEMVINSSLSGANSCFIHYDRASNGLYLRTDDNKYWEGPITPGLVGSVGNTQCAILGQGSSVAIGPNTITVNVAALFAPTFAGTKNIYAIAVNSALTPVSWTTATQFTVTTTAVVAQPSTAVSVTPNGTSGSGGTFTFTVNDPNGAADIKYVDALFNANQTAVAGCFIHYDRPSNAVYLLNDAGTQFSGAIVLGSATLASNSSCTVYGSNAFVTASGNQFVLSVPVTFTTAFNGPKNIYLFATGYNNLQGAVTNVGSFTVTAGGTNTGGGTGNGSNTPSAVSVTPSAASGLGQTFTFVYADPLGATDLVYAEALFNTGVNGAGACFVHYDRAGNFFLLRNDANTAWLGPLPAGSASSLSNSQCTLNGAGSGGSVSGNFLTFTANLAFTPTFSGVKSIFLVDVSAATLYPPWLSFGTYTVTTTGGTGGGTTGSVQAVSVSPNGSTGTSGQFVFTYTDAFGTSDIRQLQAAFTTPGSNASCLVTYTPSTNTLTLSPDSGNTTLGPVSLGQSNATLASSLCSVNAGASSYTASGTTASLSLNTSFTQGTFSGAKNITGSILSSQTGASNVTTGLGSFTVGTVVSGNSVPTSVSVQYSPGAGFTATYNDNAGYTQLRYEDIIISNSNAGGTPTYTNACYVRYDALNNLLYLRNDANTAFLGPNTPGDTSNPTLSNSQCTVDTQRFSSTPSANSLNVSDLFRITLLPPFYTSASGQKTVFLSATDTSGNVSTPVALYGPTTLP